ncbi:MAG: hypothetical protein ACLQK8_02005 [Streptosporangiaceae bacterium]
MRTSATRWRRSSWARPAGSCCHPRSGSGPPSTNPATPCSACSPRRRPGPQDLDHPPRAVPRRHPPAPQTDRYDDSAYLRGRITGALGGRAAEEVIYGDVTTGAENDLEHASDIARQMVGRW